MAYDEDEGGTAEDDDAPVMRQSASQRHTPMDMAERDVRAYLRERERDEARGAASACGAACACVVMLLLLPPALLRRLAGAALKQARPTPTKAPPTPTAKRRTGAHKGPPGAA
ncbi:hypothetical protein M885DRAFT_611738 [Pelagophyceae sp. CCMP2097]|nr:hypothetical protein M885DRAFT_611738 [Pelagophyceae sp. CCMP2097]